MFYFDIESFTFDDGKLLTLNLKTRAKRLENTNLSKARGETIVFYKGGTYYIQIQYEYHYLTVALRFTGTVTVNELADAILDVVNRELTDQEKAKIKKNIPNFRSNKICGYHARDLPTIVFVMTPCAMVNKLGYTNDVILVEALV